MPVITLLTDFGTQDYFVGAMKGVILSLNPDATIVDITHEIPPQDIQAAAFNLLAFYKDFPAGTIHVAVVDPGVGSDRRAILVECANQFFIGPDNGLFSWISEREGNFTAWQITNEKFFRNPVSSTFHGRDVFAPVAAALSNGTPPKEFGPPLENIVRLTLLLPRTTADGIEGSIIHIDRFGNCITNFTGEHINQESIAAGAKLIVNKREITSIRKFFADQSGPTNELFMLIGSAGFAEIAAQNASAAAILTAKSGDSVLLVHDDGP
ncbi:MAG TPA: SAM-dependent chlorinase/fluorinase [Pyrinomonadaceae bacterium]|nr:SAM-dependent chlorinase/fluorinase [Pyrinomonadaceae bacterium]